VHEIKFDGYRIQMHIANDEVTLRTREGLDWTGKFGAIAAAAAHLPNGIIDGEIVALNDHGTPDFGALQAALSEGKTKNLVFYAFDFLFSDGEDLRRRPLSARKGRPGEAEPGLPIRRFQSRLVSPKWIPSWWTVCSDNRPTMTSTG
jgi:bifunctional non-homologous end joining protein LigD